MHRSVFGIFAATLTGCGAGASSAPAPAAPPCAHHRGHHDGQHAGQHDGHRDGHHAGHHAEAHGHHGAMPARFDGAEGWARVFDDPARDAWQRPDEVVAALELTSSMHVADVGAGTGYFTVRLARAVTDGQVVATDIEPDMVRYLEARAQREQLSNVRAALATATGSGLAPRSVDRILVVDVWHHIADRVAYARDLAAALRPGGRVLVVDFKLDATQGPPPEHRLAPESIAADLRAAGLDARVRQSALPEQYLVEARLVE